MIEASGGDMRDDPFPSGLVRRSDDVAGIWVTFPPHAAAPEEAALLAIVRGGDGTCAAGTARVPWPVNPDLVGNSLSEGTLQLGWRALGEAVEHTLSRSDPATDVHVRRDDRDRVRATEHRTGVRPMEPELSAWRVARRRTFRAFLDTLDPDGLAMMRDPDPDVARAARKGYDGVDATVTEGAPLRSAVRRRPDLALSLAVAWDDDPEAFSAAMREDAFDDLIAKVERGPITVLLS